MATAEEIAAILAKRRAVSAAGRATLSEAVADDWDWALPASSVDRLIAALSDLSDEDLEAAHLLAHHLRDAVACLLMGRDAEKRETTR